MNRRTFITSTSSLIALATVPAYARQTPNNQSLDESVMHGDDPMLAAEYLSQLENTEYIPALYTLYSYMHADAQAIIPMSAVIGWYQQDFQSRGPQEAVATGVRTLPEWTWPVTGETYIDVAEVSYTQTFDDGESVADVVRLVFENDQWNWFFGRDGDWVNEQIDRFDQTKHVEPEGVAPFGLDTLDSFDETILQQLPATIFDESFNTDYELTESAGSWTSDDPRLPTHMFRYAAVNPPSEFDLGMVYFGEIDMNHGDDASALILITQALVNLPPTQLVGWNPNPEAGPSWSLTTTPGVDVVGQSWRLLIVNDARYIEILMYSEASLQVVAEALAGTAD